MMKILHIQIFYRFKVTLAGVLINFNKMQHVDDLSRECHLAPPELSLSCEIMMVVNIIKINLFHICYPMTSYFLYFTCLCTFIN